MDPVSASTVVGRPPGEVFAYLADVANHAEFTDHFTADWHLTREDSYGRGAGARFRFTLPFNHYPWVDLAIIEIAPPRRIVLAGRGGKFNRVRTRLVYELEPASGGATRVSASYETEPKYPSDRLVERRGWLKRRWGKALERLRGILEEDTDRGTRAGIAGGARKPATGAPIR